MHSARSHAAGGQAVTAACDAPTAPSPLAATSPSRRGQRAQSAGAGTRCTHPANAQGCVQLHTHGLFLQALVLLQAEVWISIWLPTAAVCFVHARNVFSAKLHDCPAAVHVVSSRSPLPHTTPRRSLVPLPPARACHTLLLYSYTSCNAFEASFLVLPGPIAHLAARPPTRI